MICLVTNSLAYAFEESEVCRLISRLIPLGENIATGFKNMVDLPDVDHEVVTITLSEQSEDKIDGDWSDLLHYSPILTLHEDKPGELTFRHPASTGAVFTSDEHSALVALVKLTLRNVVDKRVGLTEAAKDAFLCSRGSTNLSEKDFNFLCNNLAGTASGTAQLLALTEDIWPTWTQYFDKYPRSVLSIASKTQVLTKPFETDAVGEA